MSTGDELRAEMSYEDLRILLDELGLSERICKNDIDGDEEDFACSECRARLYIKLDGNYTMILKDETLVTMPNYCPNCGRKVVVE